VIVCHCERVSERKVVKAIHGGCASVAAVGRETGAGRGCASCHPALRRLLEEHGASHQSGVSPHAAA